jgi:hypothetical protein
MTIGQVLAVLIPVTVLVAVFVASALPSGHGSRPGRVMLREDSRVVEHAPQQGPAPADVMFSRKGYEIEALARFDMDARVLSLQYYSTDREADLSPVDAVMGWGPMSRADIVNEFSIQQERRWCYWEAAEPTVTAEEVITNSANMHLIPADDTVLRTLGALRQFDIVRVRGYLVEVRANDGWTWTSSLTRNDTGNRSCEIVWVEQLDVLR